MLLAHWGGAAEVPTRLRNKRKKFWHQNLSSAEVKNPQLFCPHEEGVCCTKVRVEAICDPLLKMRQKLQKKEMGLTR